MKIFNNGLLVMVLGFIIFGCSGKESQMPDVLKDLEKPEYNEYFESNLVDYVNDRYAGEIVSVKADSLTGKVVLKASGNPESEISSDINKFMAKATVDFFILVNGLYYLDLSVISSGTKHNIKISRNEFANYYSIKTSSLTSSDTLNTFVTQNHTPEAIEKFITQFVKTSKVNK
jgi:hypothetical protein